MHRDRPEPISRTRATLTGLLLIYAVAHIAYLSDCRDRVNAALPERRTVPVMRGRTTAANLTDEARRVALLATNNAAKK